MGGKMYRYNVGSLGKWHLVCAARPTMSEAIESIAKDRAYYESECGYSTVATLAIACPKCAGNGRIAKGRKGVRFPKYVDCPECRGLCEFPVPFVG